MTARLPVFVTSGPHVTPALVERSILYSVTTAPLRTVGATQFNSITLPGNDVVVNVVGTPG